MHHHWLRTHYKGGGNSYLLRFGRDLDMDLGASSTLGSGAGIVILLPQVLPHPEDLLYVPYRLVFSFM